MNFMFIDFRHTGGNERSSSEGYKMEKGTNGTGSGFQAQDSYNPQAPLTFYNNKKGAWYKIFSKF